MKVGGEENAEEKSGFSQPITSSYNNERVASYLVFQVFNLILLFRIFKPCSPFSISFPASQFIQPLRGALTSNVALRLVSSQY